MNRINAPTTQRRQLIDFLKGCRARLTPTQVGLPGHQSPPHARLAPRGRRRARGRQRHLVHVARAGARHPGFGRRARAHLDDAADVARRARVSVRARAAPAGAADAGAHGDREPVDQAHARRVGRAGDRAHGALGRHRLEPDRAEGHSRLQRVAARSAATCCAFCSSRTKRIGRTRCSTSRRRGACSRSSASTTAKRPAIPRSRSSSRTCPPRVRSSIGCGVSPRSSARTRRS